MLRRALNGLFLSRGFAEASLLAACWWKGSPCALASLFLPLPSRGPFQFPGTGSPSRGERFLALTMLCSTLRSLQRLAIVLCAAPLGWSTGRLISGQPFGSLAVLGILALIDMIAENAVIPTEQIEGERRAGSEVIEACPRFRPIMLAALRRSWRSFRSRRLR